MNTICILFERYLLCLLNCPEIALNPLKTDLLKFYIFLPLIFLMAYTFSFDCFGQVGPSLGGSARLFNNAKAEMDKGDYEKANTYFRQIIESNLPISPEMPYYFAVTLYELGQFDNSLNFINRYIQINGRDAEKYDEARELQRRLQEPINAILACEFCNNQGYRIQTCPTCEGKKQISQACDLCRGRGMVGCNRCFGKGLITRRNVFNLVEYHECDKCNGEGKHTCPTCDGLINVISACNTCMGQGVVQTEEICNHQAPPRHMSMAFERIKAMHAEMD
jgi:tetratricopeptide (TPR) repeat protein